MNSSTADATLNTGASNTESTGLNTLSDNVLTQNDLLGFQWQISCGMVLF